MFTRVGTEKVPDAKTLARIEAALGPEVFQKVQGRIVGIAKERKAVKVAKCDWTRPSQRGIAATKRELTAGRTSCADHNE
jgi:hypothetical protein